jgi:hypothetical protein
MHFKVILHPHIMVRFAAFVQPAPTAARLVVTGAQKRATEQVDVRIKKKHRSSTENLFCEQKYDLTSLGNVHTFAFVSLPYRCTRISPDLVKKACGTNSFGNFALSTIWEHHSGRLPSL